MPTYTSQNELSWHYQTLGHGETIVFIHGFGASSAWWQNQIDFLKKDFHIIAVDLPGHGQSSWQPVTIQRMAKDIGQIVRLEGEGNINIVASSFGALVAMEIYRQMPEIVMRLSLVGGIAKFARSDAYPAGLDIDKIRKLSGQFEGNYASVLDMFFRSLFTARERDSERFKALKHLRAHEPLPKKEALQSFLNLLEVTDYRDRLAGIICPMQFITGSDDYICPKDVMAWTALHTYNARFDEMAHCGHLPFLTEVDEYNRLLEDFLMS